MLKSKKLASAIAGVAVTAGLLLASGGTASAAPSAAAAIPSACTYQWNEPRKAATTTAVNLRSGPSTSYTSLGLLSKGTGFTHYCLKGDVNPSWAWGKVTTGANAGKSGWVRYDYLNK
ncbi:SH3 domain-containing protein [Streptomyces sp. Ncost-T10-10d]|uniref:SH3 domain-containing protein n=1 Tax=Streptomyces sp. Ncost-T10-10d TaxID=1839774 RepID=UPI00081EAB47|nr:SH3 domain-containing protein [Streptomyces sp. Ncost-T10-10d]SCF97326.1 SH3 domain-containing protein [Streptomyces sp. Ncost-T10-10d]